VRPGRAADHSPPSSAAVMEEQSYTSTHPLGHTGPVTGSLYLFLPHIVSPHKDISINGLPVCYENHTKPTNTVTAGGTYISFLASKF